MIDLKRVKDKLIFLGLKPLCKIGSFTGGVGTQIFERWVRSDGVSILIEVDCISCNQEIAIWVPAFPSEETVKVAEELRESLVDEGGKSEDAN